MRMNVNVNLFIVISTGRFAHCSNNVQRSKYWPSKWQLQAWSHMPMASVHGLK